jgi:hypothetical protein
LLEPPRIEAGCVSADKAAGIGDAPNIGAHVAAALPQAGDVERKSLDKFELAEVDVESAAYAAPVSGGATGIKQEVVDGDKAEGDAGVFESGAFTTPIAEHIRLVLPRLEWRDVLSLRSRGISERSGKKRHREAFQENRNLAGNHR